MNVSAKLSQANFIISRVKNLLPKKVLKTLYFALFHPHILYCLPVFSCTSSKNIKKIATLQKKAVGQSALSSTTPIQQNYINN
jgi:hypothetical protein